LKIVPLLISDQAADLPYYLIERKDSSPTIWWIGPRWSDMTPDAKKATRYGVKSAAEAVVGIFGDDSLFVSEHIDISTAPTTGSAPVAVQRYVIFETQDGRGSHIVEEPCNTGKWVKYADLASSAATALTGADALIGEAKSALDETYGFAATSRRSQENINFVCEKLEELRALLAASMGGDRK
jgi:hypothetical protein